MSYCFAFIAALFGCVFYLIVFPLISLDPQNIITLFSQGNQDALQHFFGWHYYRHYGQDWPLGSFSNTALGIDGSLGFFDSIPLFGLLLKPFEAFLPPLFQYRGIWLFLCYGLQGFFSFWCLRAWRCSRLLSLLGSIFFIISPILFLRASFFPVTLHESLAAHWGILCALILYRHSQSKVSFIYWLLLLILFSFIHLYLFLMIFMIYLAFLVKPLSLQNKLQSFGQLCLILSASFLSLFCLGFFQIREETPFGLGFFSFNLLAPFNPLIPINTFILPPQQSAFQGQYEGFNYLGIGVLMLLSLPCIFLLFRFLKSPLSLRQDFKKFSKTNYPLIILCLGLIFFALSPVISFGHHIILRLSLPDTVHQLWSIFRSTGRFFWPVYYLILISVVVFLDRYFSKRTSILLLIFALFLQIYDFSSFYGRYGRMTPFTSPLNIKQWQQISVNYPHLFAFDSPLHHPIIKSLTHFSLTQNKTLNLQFSVRGNQNKAINALEKTQQNILNGQFKDHTLYLFPFSQHWYDLPLPDHFTYAFLDHILLVGKNLDQHISSQPPFLISPQEKELGWEKTTLFETHDTFLVFLNPENQKQLQHHFPQLQSINLVQTPKLLILSESKIMDQLSMNHAENLQNTPKHELSSLISVQKINKQWILYYKRFPVRELSSKKAVTQFDSHLKKITKYHLSD